MNTAALMYITNDRRPVKRQRKKFDFFDGPPAHRWRWLTRMPDVQSDPGCVDSSSSSVPADACFTALGGFYFESILILFLPAQTVAQCCSCSDKSLGLSAADRPNAEARGQCWSIMVVVFSPRQPVHVSDCAHCSSAFSLCGNVLRDADKQQLLLWLRFSLSNILTRIISVHIYLRILSVESNWPFSVCSLAESDSLTALCVCCQQNRRLIYH